MHRLSAATLIFLISLQLGLQAETTNALGGPDPLPETLSAYDLLYAGKIEEVGISLRNPGR